MAYSRGYNEGQFAWNREDFNNVPTLSTRWTSIAEVVICLQPDIGNLVSSLAHMIVGGCAYGSPTMGGQVALLGEE